LLKQLKETTTCKSLQPPAPQCHPSPETTKRNYNAPAQTIEEDLSRRETTKRNYNSFSLERDSMNFYRFSSVKQLKETTTSQSTR
jgi:hypothetical protein